MNVFAFATANAGEWRWRLVDQQGQMLEESSTLFPTIAEAFAAGTEELQARRDRDRPSPAHAPWPRRH